MSTYADHSGAVRVTREMARLSVDALAERAQVNPRFIERLEGAQAVQDGPALLAVFDALAHACERLRDDAEGARAAFVQWRNERMDRTRATEDEIYSVRTGTPPDPCPLGPGECDSTDTDVITGG